MADGTNNIYHHRPNSLEPRPLTPGSIPRPASWDLNSRYVF